MTNEAQTLKVVADSSAQIVQTAQEFGLEAQDAATLQTAFSGLFKSANEWRTKAALINVTDASQTHEIKAARATRLALKEIRVTADKTRKKLKEDSLRRGKAIDGVYNVLEYLITPIEARLQGQEDFVTLQEEKRLATLKAERLAVLAPYATDTAGYTLEAMTPDQFQTLFNGLALAHEARAEAARKAESERIEAERKRIEEESRMRAENERLRKEAAEREAAMKAERDAAEAKARAEREAREKLEAELRAKREVEEREVKAKAKAARKAAAAPDADKIDALADQVAAITIPALETAPDARTRIADQFARFAKYLQTEAAKLRA